MLGGRYAWQNDAAGTRLSAGQLQIVDGGTHWMVVSAAIKHLKVSKTHAGPSSIMHDSLDVDAILIVEHE